MKKILIITDLYCASPRIPGLCKYLSHFGWEATILTVPIHSKPKGRLIFPLDYARIIEVPYQNIVDFWKRIVGIKKTESLLARPERKYSLTKKSLRDKFLLRLFILGGTFLAYPDEMRKWRKPAIAEGRKLIADEKFDLILSSSFPVTSHRIAKELSLTSKIPWVADLRDLWTQNHNYLYPLRKYIEIYLERRTLSNAKLLTTVSDSLSKKLKNRYLTSQIRVVLNGFDPKLINFKGVPLTKEFSITYTGLTYLQKQNPGKLFEALQQLIVDKLIDPNKVSVRYFGVVQKNITQLAKKYNIDAIVKQFGTLSHDEIIIKQRESQLLLLHGWEDEYETGVLPIKVFEYFAARRPILATGGTPSEQFRKILDETKSGRHAIDINQIKEIIYGFYKNFINLGYVPYEGVSLEMEKYSHYEMAKSFAQVFDQLVS